MRRLQDDCEYIGRDMRELHAMVKASGDARMLRVADRLHKRLEHGFADHLRPEHPELNWDTIAGNTTAPAAGEMTTQSGTKHEPPKTAE